MVLAGKHRETAMDHPFESLIIAAQVGELELPGGQ
jgi:hypothetical protein